MEQISTLQKMEYMQAGSELAKILAQAGYRMEDPAFSLSWGQVSEALAQTLADFGLMPEQMDEQTLLHLVQGAQKVLLDDEVNPWRYLLHQHITSDARIIDLLEPEGREDDDEGCLTEQFENATRLGDNEGYWVDCGESADLFDEF